MIIQFTLKIKVINLVLIQVFVLPLHLVLVTLVLHKGIDTIKGIHMYNNV